VLPEDKGDDRLVPEYRLIGPYRGWVSISFTRPTIPLSRRTLMPWGWVGDFVRMSLTTPSVSLPVRWSSFVTTRTDKPGLISALFSPCIFSPIHTTSQVQQKHCFYRHLSISVHPEQCTGGSSSSGPDLLMTLWPPGAGQ